VCVCSAVVRDAGDELMVHAKDLVDGVVDAIHSVCSAVSDEQIINK